MKTLKNININRFRQLIVFCQIQSTVTYNKACILEELDLKHHIKERKYKHECKPRERLAIYKTDFINVESNCNDDVLYKETYLCVFFKE